MALLLIFVITAIVLLIIKALIAEDSSSTTQPTKAEEKDLLDCNTFLPPGVLILALKPCTLDLDLFFG